MSRPLVFAFVAALTVSVVSPPRVAHAEDPSTAETQARGPRLENQSAPSAAADVPTETLERRRFSVGRFFLESLVGAAVGSGAAFGIYKAGCGDEPCIAGALGGFFANLAITPLAVFGTGRLAGGYGSASSAYLGGMLGFGVGGAAVPASPALGLAIGMALMPFMSALGFELNSRARANQALLERKTLEPTANVLSSSFGVTGFSLGLRGRL